MVKQVAIIGGGIVGATAAFYLSFLQGNENIHVTLFDEGTGQATKAAAGIISPWLSKRRNKRWYALAKRGAELYPTLVHDAQLSTQAYQQTGTIVTRKNHDDLLALYHEAKIKEQHTSAMGQVELLSAEAVKRRLPLLTDAPEGIFVSGGARIDGGHFVSELLKRASDNNLLIKHERVSLTQNGDLHTSEGQKHFDTVIIATGAWMHESLQPLGLNVKVRPQKGQLIDLTVKMPHKWQNMPVMMPEGSSDIIPFNGGKLVIGATHENDERFDLSPQPTAKQQLLDNASVFINTLTAAQVSDMRVGTRAYTEDFAPFFGAVPAQPNYLIGGGLGSSGLTPGPMIGYFLTQAVFGREITHWQDYTLPVSQYVD